VQADDGTRAAGRGPDWTMTRVMGHPIAGKGIVFGRWAGTCSRSGRVLSSCSPAGPTTTTLQQPDRNLPEKTGIRWKEANPQNEPYQAFWNIPALAGKPVCKLLISGPRVRVPGGPPRISSSGLRHARKPDVFCGGAGLGLGFGTGLALYPGDESPGYSLKTLLKPAHPWPGSVYAL